MRTDNFFWLSTEQIVQKVVRFCLVVGLGSVCLTLISLGTAVGQVGDANVSAAMESLLPVGGLPPSSVSFRSCGETDEMKRIRASARALADFGAIAVPDLQRTLNSVEQEGADSRFFPAAGWYLLAYARIEGLKALPAFNRMLADQKLRSLVPNLDYAVALSLRLTSFVSVSRERGEPLICRRREPRDALNKLIISFAQDDRAQLEAVLGPRAQEALRVLLRGEGWTRTRASLWRAGAGAQVSIGYKLDVAGRWSEPEETLQETIAYEAPVADTSRFQLGVLFKSGGNLDCGKQTVQFQKVDDPRGPFYVIDNTDMYDLLHIIGSCAAA
jgi:hypothetical protein